MPLLSAAAIILTAEQEQDLLRLSRAHKTPRKLAERAAMILLSAGETPVREIARRLGVWPPLTGAQPPPRSAPGRQMRPHLLTQLIEALEARDVLLELDLVQRLSRQSEYAGSGYALGGAAGPEMALPNDGDRALGVGHDGELAHDRPPPQML